MLTSAAERSLLVNISKVLKSSASFAWTFVFPAAEQNLPSVFCPLLASAGVAGGVRGCGVTTFPAQQRPARPCSPAVDPGRNH